MDGQKCLRGACSCYVDLGQSYCGDRCRAAAQAEVDAGPRSRCDCRHVGCLPARQ